MPHPHFFNTLEDHARYQRLKTDFEAGKTNFSAQIYKLCKDNAESAARYSDIGQWAAFMYHITKDSKYVELAWAKINNAFLVKTSGFTGNWVREFGVQFTLLYDWLYTGLSEERRTLYLSKLNELAGLLTGSTRLVDSDQVLGEYFTVALLLAATGDYNQTANDLWNDTARKHGGWLATASNLSSTKRNAIKRYTVLGEGGEWPESAEYNVGSLKIATISLAALRSDGMDIETVFPDLMAFFRAMSKSYIHSVAPDLKHAYLWGDIQDDSLHSYYRFEMGLSLAGLTGDPFLQDFMYAYLGAAGTLKAIDPWPRGFYIFDPELPRANYKELPTSHKSPGQGIAFLRSGWEPSSTFVGIHFAPRMSIDHNAVQWGEFQVYKGGWKFRHPLSYGGPSMDSRGTNGLSLTGHPHTFYGMQEYRSPISLVSKPDYDYVVATAGGHPFGQGLWWGYFKLDTNVHEHTRSFVFLKELDALVVVDRANVTAPVITGTINGSTGTVAQVNMMLSKSRKELYIHSPITPIVAEKSISWDDKKVHTLAPNHDQKIVEDEKIVWVSGVGTIAESQKKFHTRLIPAEKQWDVFLNVWDIFGNCSCELIQLNDVIGSVITKSNKAYVLLFNAIQGPNVPNLTYVNGTTGNYTGKVPEILEKVRMRTTGFTFSLNTNVPTKVLFFDLDPTVSWGVGVGSSTSKLTVSPEGVSDLELPNGLVGDVTLVAGYVPPVEEIPEVTFEKLGTGHFRIEVKSNFLV